jgi:hypothetical protein
MESRLRDCEEVFLFVRFGLGKEEGVLLLRELVSKLHVFCQTYVFGKKKTKETKKKQDNEPCVSNTFFSCSIQVFRSYR